MKTLDITDFKGAIENIKDIKKHGDPDSFKLICKASSKEEGWMKSTKAMQVRGGCIVQVSTQQGNNVAEAICFVPHISIHENEDGTRKLN